MPDKITRSETKPLETTPTKTKYSWRDLTPLRPGGGLEAGDQTIPQCRCKHTTCYYDGCVYVHGGRNGGMCHRDLWRYDLTDNTWQKLTCSGNQPMSPQEHTALAYKNQLYVFGGQFCYSLDRDAPLWILNLDTLVWRKQGHQSEVLTPGGRRGHSAVIYQDIMCIYGGYIDLKGSSSEVWLFDLEQEMWHLASSNMHTDYSAGGRHNHSAVVYDGAMWVYGGMADLTCKDDLWRWDFICSQWNRIKSRPSPPALKGHSACVVADQMLLYGGSSQGCLSSTLWCYHMPSNVWTKLVPLGASPPTVLQHCAVVVLASLADRVSADRSQSYPHLRNTLSPTTGKTSVTERPYSSPPKVNDREGVNTETPPPLLFKNKIVPSLHDPPPSYKETISYNGGADGGTNNVKNQPKNHIQILNVNRTLRPGSEGDADTCQQNDMYFQTPVERFQDSSPEDLTNHRQWAAVMNKRSNWRSTPSISHDSTSDLIPLIDIPRNYSPGSVSLSSAEYMDTIVGCHVNRIITTSANNILHGRTSTDMITDDSPRRIKRPRSTDQKLNDELDWEVSTKRSLSVEKLLERESISEWRCVKGTYTPTNKRQTHARCRSNDDLKLEDVENTEECDEPPDLFRSNQYRFSDSLTSSDDLLNTSNYSETTPLIKHDKAKREILPRTNERPTVNCFSKKYSKLSKSCESIPYGMTNVLYGIHLSSAGDTSSGAGVSARLTTDRPSTFSEPPPAENQPSHVPRSVAALRQPQCPESMIEEDANQIVQLSQQQDQQLWLPYPPSYESLEAPSDTETMAVCNEFTNPCHFIRVSQHPCTATKIQMTDREEMNSKTSHTNKSVTGHQFESYVTTQLDTEDRPEPSKWDEVPSAWASSGSTPEHQPNVKMETTTKKIEETISCKQDGSAHNPNKFKGNSHSLFRVQQNTPPRHFYMYIVGGQTTESMSFGYKPLLLWQLDLQFGVR